MKVKELNELRRKIFDELIKIEDVKEALKNVTQVYIYDISEGEKHIVETFTYETQVNLNYLKEHGFTANANISKIFTVNKQTKQAF